MTQTSSNVTASPSHIFLTAPQMAAAIIFSVTSIFGLLIYALVLSILLVNFRQFKSNFYCIVISLSFTEISFLALMLFYVVPCTSLQRHILAPYDHVAGIIEGLAYNAQGVHLIFIAVNRLAYARASTPNPQQLDKIFNGRHMVVFWIAVIWVVSLLITLPIKLHGCELIYHYDALSFIPNCQSSAASLANVIISGALPVSVTLLHILTWLVVYAKGKGSLNSTTSGENVQLTQRRSRERRILVQFTLISIALFTFWGSFWIFPRLLPGNAGAFVVITFGILNCTVNPLTYLKFNKLVKAKAKDAIRKALAKVKGNTVVTPANMSDGKTDDDTRRRRSTMAS